MLRTLLLSLLLTALPSSGWPADPVCPGSIPPFPINDHGLITSVAAAGDLVVTIDQRGITTWSIADPASPTQIGFLEIAPEWGNDRYDREWNPYGDELLIHQSGEWACLFESFTCFDLRDPRHPRPYRWDLDEWPCDVPYSSCSFEKRVDLTAETLAVGVYPDTIWLLDISENRPSEWTRPASWAGRFDSIVSLAFAGDVLVVLQNYDELSAWDVSDLANPVELGTGTLDTGGYSGFRLRGHPRGAVAVSEAWRPTGIVAISTTRLPELGSVNLSGDLDWDTVERLEFIGDRGAAHMVRRDPITGESIHYFAQIRVAAPFLLIKEAAVDADTEMMAMTDSHIVGTPMGSHLEVFSFGDELTRDGASQRVGEALDVAAGGGIGVAANGEAGITVLDLSDPERPEVLSTLEIDDQAVYRVEKRGPVAFVLTDTGLGSVNLAQPNAPYLMAHRELEDVCCELELEGDLAVVGSRSDCTMVVLDVSNPSHVIKTSETLFCDPNGSGERAEKIDLVGELAHIDSERRISIVDLSNPWLPELRFDLYDYDLRGTLPADDHILAAYGTTTALCQIRDDELIVGRTYDHLPASRIDSPRAGLVNLYDFYEGHRLVDFSDLIEPDASAAPASDDRLPVGEIDSDVWFRPSRHRLNLVSLECRPPEASFRFAGTGLEFWFEDTSMYQVTDRMWDFGDGTTSTERAPFHEFSQPGLHRVMLTVSSDNGIDTVTEVIDLRERHRPDESPTSTIVD